MTDGTDLAAEVAALARTPRKELQARFRALYGVAPPKRLGLALLRRAVAQRLQEQAQDGPDPVLRRRLGRLATELRRTGEIRMRQPPPVKPGTRLLREWQGETHVVTVTADGFVYREQRYRSLSAIARAITGTRWSGPAFFGLNGEDRR